MRTRTERPRVPCIACGRTVAVRHEIQTLPGLGGVGKARTRHKCPHGRWCIAGRLSHGFTAGSTTCPDCNRELQGREQ